PRPRPRARRRRAHRARPGRRRQRACRREGRGAVIRRRVAACALLLALCAGASAADGDAMPEPFEVLVFGDPQPQTLVDVDYFRRDIVEPLAGGHRARLGIVLGDIASDNPSLYPAVKSATAELDIPWLYVPGNHDVDAAASSDADSLRAFHQAFGDDTFIRRTGRANFIGLDDVVAMPGRKPA